METVRLISHAAAEEMFSKYVENRRAIGYIAASSPELLGVVLAARPQGRQSLHTSLRRFEREVTVGPYLGADSKPPGTTHIVGLWEDTRPRPSVRYNRVYDTASSLFENTVQRLFIRSLGSLPVRSAVQATKLIIDRTPMPSPAGALRYIPNMIKNYT